MKRAALLTAAAAALLSGGCAQIQHAEQKAADAADGVLVGAEWAICRAATVGSVLRRYGASPERMEAWRRLCQPTVEDFFAPPVQIAPATLDALEGGAP